MTRDPARDLLSRSRVKHRKVTPTVAKPVTRSELDEALVSLATKKAVARLATKEELADAVARLATKQELAEAIAPLATRAEMHGMFEAWVKILMKEMDARFTAQSRELARHVEAVLEQTRTMIAVVDEKYSDLPRA